MVSDLTPGLDGLPQQIGADHVLGISPASTSLAQLTLRAPVDDSLDLGTGCGVQALHLAAHSGHVVATDVNQRALGIARFNAVLNEVGDRVEVREGSFFEPVRGERYDLIATNPPFVISPATGERLVYRDSGLPGDQVVEDIVRAAPEHLIERGWCQVLANWVVERDRPWDERLGRLAGPGRRRARRAARARRSRGVRRALAQGLRAPPGDRRRPGRVPPSLRHLARLAGGPAGRGDRVRLGQRAPQRRHRPARSLGLAVRRRAADRARHRGVGGRRSRTDARCRRAAASSARTSARRPSARSAPRIRRRSCSASSAASGARGRPTPWSPPLVGACDGELPVGAILDAVAQLLDRDPAETRATYLPVVRELVDEGFLFAGDSEGGLEVSVGEVVALEQERLAGDLRERVRHAVAEVELGGRAGLLPCGCRPRARPSRGPRRRG